MAPMRRLTGLPALLLAGSAAAALVVLRDASAFTPASAAGAADARLRGGAAAGRGAQQCPPETTDTFGAVRHMAVGAAAVLVLLAGGLPAKAGTLADIQGGLANDNKNLDGYNFDALGDKLGAKLSLGYEKVKPVCEEQDLIVQGGASTGSSQMVKKVICDRADNLKKKGWTQVNEGYKNEVARKAAEAAEATPKK